MLPRAFILARISRNVITLNIDCTLILLNSIAKLEKVLIPDFQFVVSCDSYEVHGLLIIRFSVEGILKSTHIL